MKKRSKDVDLIRSKMDLTFSLRRKEVVEVQAMVMEIQERWPALFLQEQICYEFLRITTKDLFGTFTAAMDEYCPRLIKLYRVRKGAFGQGMENLLDSLDEQTSDIAQQRMRMCLEGLPLFVRDSGQKLFLKCLDTDPEEKQTAGVKMGVLTVLVDDGGPTPSQMVNRIAVVLEETIVLSDLPDIPTAFAYLFGLLYALNIEFPKEHKYTFETVQHIIMGLSTSCSQR
ncbi:uncharacterized protein, partial [Pseudochaenichthys georgianus]|uniref:uncharacterized protein n=1 Tax=Pseudochaenichthys georgianus TaxID=52239 RepID=UPI00146A16A4